MTFLTNQSFEAHDVKFDSPQPGCEGIPTEGTWQFISVNGVSGLSVTQFDKSDLIFVTFPGGVGACNFTLTTWEINAPISLCLYADPDSPCIGPVFTRA